MTAIRTSPTRAGTPGAVLVGILLLADVMAYLVGKLSLVLDRSEMLAVQGAGVVLIFLTLRVVGTFCTPYKRVSGQAAHGAAVVFCAMGAVLCALTLVMGQVLTT